VFAAAFSLAFVVTTIAWVPLRRILGWLLLPLGHHALSAYAIHIFIVAVLWKWAPLLFGDDRSATQNAVVQLSGVAIVWGAIVLWPEMATVADCCIHCRRAGAFDLGRLFSHVQTVSEMAGAPGDAELGARRGTPVCGHADAHEHCP